MPRKQLSVTEVAERKGVTRSAVLYAIERGDLGAVKVGRQWIINEDAAEGWKPLSHSEAGQRGGRAVADRFAQARAQRPPAPRRPVGRPRKTAKPEQSPAPPVPQQFGPQPGETREERWVRINAIAGRHRGLVSPVDEFIRRKQEEIDLEDEKARRIKAAG